MTSIHDHVSLIQQPLSVEMIVMNPRSNFRDGAALTLPVAPPHSPAGLAARIAPQIADSDPVPAALACFTSSRGAFTEPAPALAVTARPIVLAHASLGPAIAGGDAEYCPVHVHNMSC